MKKLFEFFRQDVPKDRGEINYYHQSMKLTDQLLAIYFFLSFVMIFWATKRLMWFPLMVEAALLFNIFFLEKMSSRLSLLLHTVIVIAWFFWFMLSFGWGVGGQHVLILLILMVFFCLYETPFTKILYFLLILSVRMYMFLYTSAHEPLIVLDGFNAFCIQTLNTVCVFVILACCCIVFSSNLQEGERQLLLKNELLHTQAETDPLTKLINRRGLMEIMNCFVAANPQAMYCVAIADIDFFKRVNDTYGHNCGDYVLQTLSSLFMEHAAQSGFSVGRWGGEEFCFFFPDTNIDDAGRIVTDILVQVRKMPLEYEGKCFSITLTAGVEENDYRSPLHELIESADRKLYRGKENGRNQIVF